MRRLRGIPADEYILAGDRDGALALGAIARSLGFSVFAGPKDDVLARFAMAATSFGLERVVRATGDNPFVSVELARIALAVADDEGADYVGLAGMPTGMGVEVVDASALLRAAESASSTYDREHVCPFLYGHPADFSIVRPQCPPSHYFPEGRLTIDTAFDYHAALAIYKALGDEPSDAEVLAWLHGNRKAVRA
jgi:spore coat polysaccharide biosynthesis protein SpsF